MRSLIGTAILLACAVLTYQRSHVWQSPESIWAEAVKESPLLPRTHLNLSGVYQEQKRYDDAIAEDQKAWDLSGDVRRMRRHQEMTEQSAESDMALLYLMKGDFRMSARMNGAILSSHPNDKTALINMAAAEMALGMCPQAFVDYMKAGIADLPHCSLPGGGVMGVLVQ